MRYLGELLGGAVLLLVIVVLWLWEPTIATFDIIRSLRRHWHEHEVFSGESVSRRQRIIGTLLAVAVATFIFAVYLLG